MIEGEYPIADSDDLRFTPSGGYQLTDKPNINDRRRLCQTNLNGPAKGADLRRSGRQLTPLGQGGSTVLFENIAAVEVAVLVEVVVD